MNARQYDIRHFSYVPIAVYSLGIKQIKMNIKGKTIVVTGAGNGMGREVALLLLKKGAKVAAVDLREEFLNETKSLSGDLSNQLSLHAMDISDQKAVDALPDQVINIHGSVDAIMNIAGIIQPFVKVNQLDLSIVTKVMNVNFYGTLFIVKAFLPHLLKRPSAHVLNVSSMGGFLPVPGQSIYGASKAAVKLFTEGLSSELAGTNVGVSIVFPGAIGTNITKNSNVNIPGQGENNANNNYKVMAPTKAAELIVGAMENNKFRVMVGSDASFMDKLYRIAPVFAKNFIAKKMKDLLK